MKEISDISDMMDELAQIAGIGNGTRNKENASFGILDSITKNSRDDDKPALSECNSIAPKKYIPPKLQDTPVEGLIMKFGGGSTNDELGLEKTNSSFVKVEGVDDNPAFVNNISAMTEMGNIEAIKSAVSNLVTLLGGKVIW